jgi:hypothetical protein
LRWKVHVPRTASSSSTPMTACAPSRERHHWRLHQPGPDAHRGLATAAVGLARRALQIASAGDAEEPRCERGGPAPSDDYLPTTAWCDVLHRRPTPSLASARLLRALRPPSRRNRPNACPTAPAPFRHVRVPELRPCAFAPTLLNPGGSLAARQSFAPFHAQLLFPLGGTRGSEGRLCTPWPSDVAAPNDIVAGLRLSRERLSR